MKKKDNGEKQPGKRREKKQETRKKEKHGSVLRLNQ